VRELPAGPQRCVTFVWATTQGDFVAIVTYDKVEVMTSPRSGREFDCGYSL
jgi:hypothetical protein